MKFFKKSEEVIGSMVDTIDSMTIPPNNTVPRIPTDATGEYPASFGDEINLVLLVKEHGSRKKERMANRRAAILKELEQIDKELVQLDVLLDAANSL